MIYLVRTIVRMESNPTYTEGGEECADYGYQIRVVGSKKEAAAVIRKSRKNCICRSRSCLDGDHILRIYNTPRTKAQIIDFANDVADECAGSFFG